MYSNAVEKFRHFIRPIEVREEGREGEPGTVRVSPANKKLFPLLATGGSPGVIQRRGVGRRNGEINKAGQATGAPGVYFITFMFFMVKCICISSVCSASSVVNSLRATDCSKMAKC